MSTSDTPVGKIRRRWRERWCLSQFALAAEADVSARHVSFLETGRARPSREMLLRLMERLDVPLRDTITIFGTPVDITLSELAIEAFFPADPVTAETLRRIAEDPVVCGGPYR